MDAIACLAGCGDKAFDVGVFVFIVFFVGVEGMLVGLVADDENRRLVAEAIDDF